MWKTGTRVTKPTWPGSSLTRTRRRRPPTSLALVRTEQCMLREASPLSSRPLHASAHHHRGCSRFFAERHAWFFGVVVSIVWTSTPKYSIVVSNFCAHQFVFQSPPYLPHPVAASALLPAGITLHEVTTGLEPPLDGIAWHQMRDGRVPPPPPELKRSDDLWTLIVEMMSGEPEARPSASQILRHPRVEEATIGAY